MTKRFRGIPDPLPFSLGALADDQLLTENEVAALRRESISGAQKKRLSGRDGLEWVYVDGRPRCRVGSLKRKLAGSAVRLPSVSELAGMRKTKPKPPALRENDRAEVKPARSIHRAGSAHDLRVSVPNKRRLSTPKHGARAEVTE